jgi:hypothetical protein
VKKTRCEKAIFGASLVDVVGPHSSWQFEVEFFGQQVDRRLEVAEGVIAARETGRWRFSRLCHHIGADMLSCADRVRRPRSAISTWCAGCYFHVVPAQ